jgi:hypothetical protein
VYFKRPRFGYAARSPSHQPFAAGPAYAMAAPAAVGVLGAIDLLERAPYKRQARKA